jgi:ABC-type uncharacterized transport system involved in gliding motility auxiliary subunit
MKNTLAKLSGILGLVLGAASVISVLFYPTRTFQNAVTAGLALVLLVIFFISYFEPFKAVSIKRSTQLGLNSVLMVVLFIFIAVVFNLMARQYYFRTDLSSTSDYSIAPQTINVVEGLESEIRITVFGQDGTPAFKKAGDLLEGYRYLNKNITYSVIDLDRAPLRAKEYGVNKYDSIVVKGNKKTVVVQGINEETVTNGIIRATRETAKKIYFIKGHGEKDIRSSARNGMSKAASGLRAIGYEVSDITLNASEAVPGDADLLIIAGPAERFSEEDVLRLDNYMTKGGKLSVLFDPGYDPSAIINRAAIRMGGGMVADVSSNFGGKDPMVPLVSSYPETPVTGDFTLSTVYPGAAPLDVGGLESSYEYFTFVSTSPDSTIVKDGKTIGNRGEQVIAAAAGSRQGKDILMVFGDSDFVSNAFYDVAGNSNLFLNSINWALEEEDLISITPGQEDFVPLYLTREQGTAILYAAVIGIPAFVFACGFAVWWRRKSL